MIIQCKCMLNQSQRKYYVTSATPLALADVKVLSSNPIHGKVFLIQHYVIKFISDLFVILTAIGWFIVNIQSDLFRHWCLESQTFGTPRLYTLSPSKSIKRSNYGEFLKDKNALLMYTTVSSLTAYKYALNLESMLTQHNVCITQIRSLSGALVKRTSLFFYVQLSIVIQNQSVMYIFVLCAGEWCWIKIIQKCM